MSVRFPVEYPLYIDTPTGRITATEVHKAAIREDELQCATVTVRLTGTAHVGYGSDAEYALYDLDYV